MVEPEQKDTNKTKDDTDFTELERLRDKFMPWQREIMIVGMILLIALVVFLGFARGGLEVCNDVGGFFDWKLKCHPYHFNETDAMGNIDNASYDRVGQKFVIPKLEDLMEGIKND